MVQTVFLDHLGVMGTLHLPIMTTEALPPPTIRPHRVPLFRCPILDPILQGWKTKMTVDSYTAISLAKAMGHSFLASLGHGHRNIPTSDTIDTHCITPSIIGLANDIHVILGDALTTATTMFPHKLPAKPGKGTLPQHLWPKSARHDVSNIRHRAKAIRRLINHETKARRCTPPEELSRDPSLPLSSSVNKPLSLRTVLSPPPKNVDSLGVLLRTDTSPTDQTTLQATHSFFKGMRRTTRLLIRHARNLRRLKYGKRLLRIFVKKPSAALKSILHTSERTRDKPTLPTSLSVLRDETFRRLLVTPTEVIAHLEKLETNSMSPNPTLPPGAPFSWLGNVRPTPTSSVPMLIGQITPAIFQEALRRTPNHKVAGPDGVPGLVLKHMPPAFHEAIRLIFQAMAITGITPPHGYRATQYSSIKRGPD